MTDPSPHLGEEDAARSEGAQQSSLSVRLIVAVPALLAGVVLAYGFTEISILFHFSPTEDAPLGNWRQAAWWSLVALLIFFAFATVAGIALAYSILAPLRALSNALARVAEGTLARARVDAGAGAEMAAIGESFNSMAQYLHMVFKERNRYLVEASSAGTLTLDAVGRITGINTAGEQILRLRAESIVGNPPSELSPEILKSEIYRPLFEMISQAVCSDEPFYPRTLELGDPQEDGLRLSLSLSLERSADGLPKGFMFTFRDVGRGEEMARLLERTDQLATMGAFSMGLAHELRNPLGSIKGMAQLLEEACQQDESSRMFAQQIASEVDRMDAFVRELLEYGQEAPTPATPCDLSLLAHEALNSARAGTVDWEAKNLEFDLDLVELKPILLQKERLIRALANIVGNALEAAPDDACIRLSTGRQGEGQAARIAVDIANEGPPIPEEDLGAIFEPFFTTKSKGTGLGLAIAYQIVIQNGGYLKARSEDGWTRFTMSFPAPFES